jgi:hypothetical protein
VCVCVCVCVVGGAGERGDAPVLSTAVRSVHSPPLVPFLPVYDHAAHEGSPVQLVQQPPAPPVICGSPPLHVRRTGPDSTTPVVVEGHCASLNELKKFPIAMQGVNGSVWSCTCRESDSVQAGAVVWLCVW